MDFSKRLSDEAEVRVTMHAQSREGPLASLLKMAQSDGTHPHRREGLVKVDRRSATSDRPSPPRPRS